MNIQFNTVLIPLDFTANTRLAIKKAMSVCHGPNVTIHLVHVFQISATNLIRYHQYLAPSVHSDRQMIRETKDRMAAWESYVRSFRNDVKVCSWIEHGFSVQKTIVKKIKEISPDLIVVGKRSHHSWFPFLNTLVPAKIARKTGVPVLTVKPGSLNESFKMAVLPVGADFPEKKVAIINALRRNFHIHVRLIAFLDRHDDPHSIPPSLLNAYRVLKSSLFHGVSYEVIWGRNKARAIIEYCNKVGADLLIADPIKETAIGWFNKQVSDVLPAQSKTQVLATGTA